MVTPAGLQRRPKILNAIALPAMQSGLLQHRAQPANDVPTLPNPPFPPSHHCRLYVCASAGGGRAEKLSRKIVSNSLCAMLLRSRWPHSSPLTRLRRAERGTSFSPCRKLDAARTLRYRLAARAGSGGSVSWQRRHAILVAQPQEASSDSRRHHSLAGDDFADRAK